MGVGRAEDFVYLAHSPSEVFCAVTLKPSPISAGFSTVSAVKARIGRAATRLTRTVIGLETAEKVSRGSEQAYPTGVLVSFLHPNYIESSPPFGTFWSLYLFAHSILHTKMQRNSIYNALK